MIYTVTDNNERVSREEIYQNLEKRRCENNDNAEINCFYDYAAERGMTFTGYSDQEENYSVLVDQIGKYIHKKMNKNEVKV